MKQTNISWTQLIYIFVLPFASSWSYADGMPAWFCPEQKQLVRNTNTTSFIFFTGQEKQTQYKWVVSVTNLLTWQWW